MAVELWFSAWPRWTIWFTFKHIAIDWSPIRSNFFCDQCWRHRFSIKLILYMDDIVKIDVTIFASDAYLLTTYVCLCTFSVFNPSAVYCWFICQSINSIVDSIVLYLFIYRISNVCIFKMKSFLKLPLTVYASDICCWYIFLR